MTDPENIKNLLLDVIRLRMNSHPRGLQKAIGPSEIGHPCDRWLGYKLLDVPKNPNAAERDRWRSTVGVAVHGYLAETFEDYNKALGIDLFAVEERVNIGTIYVGNVHGGDGEDCYGGGDLYIAGVVVDWKIVGKNTLDTVRRAKHPGQQYQVQVHGYGRGHQRAGRPVEHVSVFYLPAAGPLSQSIFWSEPYDEQVCVDALDRVSRIKTAVYTRGTAALADLEPRDHHCASRCDWYKPESNDLALGCPGENVQSWGIAGLLPPGT